MGNGDAPAGWYPDPAGPGRERWWDGAGWTGQVRDASPHAWPAPDSSAGSGPYPDGPDAAPTAPLARWQGPAPAAPYAGAPGPAPTAPFAGEAAMMGTAPPEPPRSSLGSRVLLLGLIALILGAGGIGLGIWLAERDDDGSAALADASVADPVEVVPDGGEVVLDGGEVAPDGSEVAPDDTGAVTPDEPADGADGSAGVQPPPPEEPAGSVVQPPPAPSEHELLQVNFDGVCEVWLTRGELSSQQVRPWQFPGECPSAPVSLVGVQERWIVVVASLNGNDFRYDEALSRAAREGLHGRVLWSSHYPSLNPDLWVVYDGPFQNRGAAAGAAEWRGDSSYPRVLSDDLGDRYCLDVSGNCQGERRN